MRTRPSSTSSLSSRFTLWRADHGRQVRLGVRPVQADLAGRVALLFLCQAGEPHGQAPGEVEEVELLDVAGQASKLDGQSLEQRVTQRRLLAQQLEAECREAQRRVVRLGGARALGGAVGR